MILDLKFIPNLDSRDQFPQISNQNKERSLNKHKYCPNQVSNGTTICTKTKYLTKSTLNASSLIFAQQKQPCSG